MVPERRRSGRTFRSQLQTQFACVECGFSENADLVGAINILRAGYAQIACQVTPERGSATGNHLHRGFAVLADAEEPPLRFALGTSILPRARAANAECLQTWEAWEEVSNATMGEPQKAMAELIEQLADGTPDRT